MNRPMLIAGNWKMNLDRASATALAEAIAGGVDGQVETALFPPFVYLDAVRRVLEGTPVAHGGQNMYPAESGAFTGEVSGPMLVDLGCRYVLLGHSERRHVIGESDAFVGEKVAAAFAVGLVPVLCVGETLEEREADRTMEVIARQMEAGCQGVGADEAARMVIAYEPVWAIGTGRTATPEQAQAVHADLRQWLVDRYNADVARQIRIQYGGSVKPSNASDLLSQPDIDGALVGGASLEAGSFLDIVAAGAAVG